MSPRVVLVGLPGAGKTTTGRRLARILVTEFADSDDLLERAEGRAVAEIFAASGEDAFRMAESAAVKEALANFAGVLALGGGALTWPDTCQAVRSSPSPVVLLRAGVAVLSARVGDGHTRPLIADDPSRRLTELAAARDAVYRECATFTVETDHRTPGQVAAHIAARLHEAATQ